MINLPVDWITSLKEPISELFTDLGPLIFLLIGVFLGVFIIERIVDLIRGEKSE